MMNTGLGVLLAFILTIGILVTVHEFGHFWVARKLGIKVLRFSIGFGKPIFTWGKPGGTEYVLASIPLGGYVKMLDERIEAVDESEKDLAFSSKSVWVRIAVVCAGPFANFLFAILAYALMFSLGVPGIKPIVGKVVPDSPAATAGLQVGDEIRHIDNQVAFNWQNVNIALINRIGEKGSMTWGIHRESLGDAEYTMETPEGFGKLHDQDLLAQLGVTRYLPPIPPVIGDVNINTPAYTAGLQSGDEITSLDGKVVTSWRSFVKIVRENPEKTLSLEFMRNGESLSVPIKVKSKLLDDETVIGFVGVSSAPYKWPDELKSLEQYSPAMSLWQGVEKTWSISVLSLKLLYRMVFGEVSSRNIGGPISIAKGAGQSLDAGLVHFLGFLGLLSVSLGVLNLLPLPVLDGGHLLFYLIELVRGKQLSEKTQLVGFRIGVAVLIAITILAFYNDLSRL